MSLFLIVYDRDAGKLVQLREFDASQRDAASRARLNLELGATPNEEILILEAESQSQLRRTHARYFGDDAVNDLARAEASRLAELQRTSNASTSVSHS